MGFARTDDGHNHRQRATLCLSVYFRTSRAGEFTCPVSQLQTTSNRQKETEAVWWARVWSGKGNVSLRARACRERRTTGVLMQPKKPCGRARGARAPFLLLFLADGKKKTECSYSDLPLISICCINGEVARTGCGGDSTGPACAAIRRKAGTKWAAGTGGGASKGRRMTVQ